MEKSNLKNTKDETILNFHSPQTQTRTLWTVLMSLSPAVIGVATALPIIFVIIWFVPSMIPLSPPPPSSDFRERAEKLQLIYPLIDGHNDVPWRYRKDVNDSVQKINFENIPSWQTDITRLKEGGVGAQFWSVYVSCAYQGKDAVRATLEQIDVVHKFNRLYPDTFALALSPNDIRKNFEEKKISSLMGMEGGHQVDASLGALRMMYNLGVRYMTLTHNCNNDFADAASNGCTDDVDCRVGTCSNAFCTEPQTDGITPFGRELILEMNRLGMLVDISHVSDTAMRRVLEITKGPVIFSHSSAYALCNHIRNVPNDVLLKLKENNGIVMIAFLSDFISCSQNSTLSQVVDHIDYIAKGTCPSWKPNCNPGNAFPGIGTDHIGYGSDFDGADYFPVGLKDVSDFVNLTGELLRRGYTDVQVANIIGGNLLRVFDDAVALAEASDDIFPLEEVIFPDRQCRSTN